MKRAAISSLVAATFVAAAAVPGQALDTITPQAAHDLVTSDPDVFILDVRTAEEWKWVGHPGRNGKGEGAGLEGKVVQVSWKIPYKGKMIDNPSFLSDVDQIFGRDPNRVLILMCRSGQRGVWAAAVLEPVGYRVLNMEPGFEGRKNDDPALNCPPNECTGYRDFEGWKFEGLPYNNGGKGYGD